MDDYETKLLKEQRHASKKLSPGVIVTTMRAVNDIQLWVHPFAEGDSINAVIGPSIDRGTRALVISIIELQDQHWGARPWVLLLLADGRLGWCRILDRLRVIKQ